MDDKMETGFIGLGRMGKNMVKRILKSGKVRLHAWNRTYAKVKEVEALGANGHRTIKGLVDALRQKRRIVWLMLPAGRPTENIFQDALRHLKKGDIIIDGANSNFHDTIRRHREAEKKGVSMLDVGVSGGIIAAARGYPMMVGGRKDTWEYCKPLFDSFAIPEGCGLVGPGGAGHYVKMTHNAIEYGMMQAIAEGFDLLKNGRFDELDLKKIAGIWNHRTIISSFLMEMTEKALKKDEMLSYLEPYVDESGEGRWAAAEAIEQKVPFAVNSYALNARYISQNENSFAFRMLAAQREQFGGHAVKTRDGKAQKKFTVSRKEDS